MLTLPAMKQSLPSAQIQRSEPPITIRQTHRSCLIQVACPEFRSEELGFNLDQDRILLTGHPLRTTSGPPRPANFQHRISLGFSTSGARIKAIYLDGVYSVFIQSREG